MDGGVLAWILSFVRAVTSGSSPSAPSSETPLQGNGGASPSVQGNAAASTSPLTSATTLAVIRDRGLQTSGGFFGRLYWEGNYLCYTMERIAVAVPEGTYPARKRDSVHFGMIVIGIDVPNRTDIEMHPANRTEQLEGCIAPGESIDNGALDSSRSAFDRVMATVPDEFTVEISSTPA
jgi:hypothetical protein